MLFELGILRSRSFNIPVISVGNITVGGAGKTPHVEYLVRLLRDRAQVAVLSRGYKRITRGYVLATEGTTAADVGDEPYQMFSKYGRKKSNDHTPIYVAVNADRCKGIERIQSDEKTSNTDVIILDDAYQHRYVKPGVNILLVDYHRLINYDKLLPAGRLREPEEGKSRADVVIVSKCPKDLKPMEFRVVQKALNLYPYQKLFFTSLNYSELQPVFQDAKPFRLTELQSDYHLILLTGIASPQQLLLDLNQYTQHVTHLSFSDHHRFNEKDVEHINQTFRDVSGKKVIITTEKDAARLIYLEGLSDAVRQNLYAIPIEISFMLDRGTLFDEYILSYVHKNSKNSILLKNKGKEKRKSVSQSSDRKEQTSGAGKERNTIFFK